MRVPRPKSELTSARVPRLVSEPLVATIPRYWSEPQVEHVVTDESEQRSVNETNLQIFRVSARDFWHLGSQQSEM
jgi:hypothetical protein